jgi:hypothetical protein
MGKRKRKKRAKKLVKGLKAMLDRMQMSVRFIGGGPGDPLEGLAKAGMQSYREHHAENPPERCPCGRKWKNCKHRDDLLGTHH